MNKGFRLQFSESSLKTAKTKVTKLLNIAALLRSAIHGQEKECE
jgi:hypothetical protein